MSTLYRKYRPTNFRELVDQNHIKLTIQNQIKASQLGHAYLFCGPRAVGKTSLARIIAKAINCLERKDGESEPCNKCSVCLEINKNKGLDIFEIDAASHTGVDNIRENIISMAQVASARYKYKVFIIDEVHMISTQAFNALLKTLEEPPSRVVFILCTTEAHKIPLTIISRCQRFDFKKIGVSDIAEKLKKIALEEKIKVDKKVLELIARQSGGHLRDAESLFSQVIAIATSEEDKEITLDEASLVIPRSDLEEVLKIIDYLGRKKSAEAIQLINKIIEDGVDLKIFTQELVEVLRKMLLAKISPSLALRLGIDLGESIEKTILALLPKFRPEELISLIEEFSQAIYDLSKYFIPQMALEIVIVKNSFSEKNDFIEENDFKKIAPAEVSLPKKENSPVAANIARNLDKNLENKILVSLESILKNWNNFISLTQKSNPSLSFILRACQPKKLENNELLLAFKYKFHKDQADRPENKAVLSEAAKEIFGQTLAINPILVEENLDSNFSPAIHVSPQESFVENNNSIIKNVLDTFGGKIVS